MSTLEARRQVTKVAKKKENVNTNPVFKEGRQFFSVACANALTFLAMNSSLELRRALLEQEDSEFDSLLRKLIVKILFEREDDPQRLTNLFAVIMARVERASVARAVDEIEQYYMGQLDPSVQGFIKERSHGCRG